MMEECQAVLDGLLDEDRTEMSERVAYLEKRVREHQDEIVCLKGALSDVTRRLGILEVAKSQNSILPSKPMPKSPRRAPSGQERPKSYIEATPRVGSAQSHRPTPRGPSATSIDKKWGSMSNSLEETNGHRGAKSAGLNHAKRSTSHGSLAIKQTKTRGIKEPTWNEEEKYLRMHLKGRPVILYAPSNVENFDVKAPQDPPKEELKLEWVYGYRGRDCRSNLYMLPTGEVIYFSAGVVVLHNIEEQTQRHYNGHTDDIKCIAIHPDQVKVASGQVSGHDKKEGKAHVRLWDSVTLNTLCVFGEGDFSRGVCCVSFSKLDGGKHLLAVDESDQHKLSIWDVSRESKVTKIAESKASNDPVTQCEFHPYEEDQIVESSDSNKILNTCMYVILGFLSGMVCVLIIGLIVYLVYRWKNPEGANKHTLLTSSSRDLGGSVKYTTNSDSVRISQPRSGTHDVTYDTVYDLEEESPFRRTQRLIRMGSATAWRQPPTRRERTDTGESSSSRDYTWRGMIGGKIEVVNTQLRHTGGDQSSASAPGTFERNSDIISSRNPNYTAQSLGKARRFPGITIEPTQHQREPNFDITGISTYPSTSQAGTTRISVVSTGSDKNFAFLELEAKKDELSNEENIYATIKKAFDRMKEREEEEQASYNVQ